MLELGAHSVPTRVRFSPGFPKLEPAKRSVTTTVAQRDLPLPRPLRNAAENTTISLNTGPVTADFLEQNDDELPHGIETSGGRKGVKYGWM